MVEEYFSKLRTLDWSDLSAINATCSGLLEEIDEDRMTLRAMLESAAQAPDLVRLSERLDHLDKIVLHDDPSGWRLRLHVFLLDCADWPHSHRWTFTSRILEGGYQHNFFGDESTLSEQCDSTGLSALATRIEQKGDCYTLQHGMIHTALGRPGTISLLVRGPSVKNRFIVTDAATGKMWWRYGSAVESPELLAHKRMSAEHITMRVESLVRDGVLP